ncbi:hypothetical protein I600_2845 [Maribacter dokdonensis DSW-8]|nr:hypothetical protein I600_2845 [Maribacter dokdonensis DSW-8]
MQNFVLTYITINRQDRHKSHSNFEQEKLKKRRKELNCTKCQGE